MRKIFIVEWRFIETRSWSHVYLTADNRFYSSLFGFTVKFYSTEQCAVIRYTYGLHIELSRSPQEVTDADGAV